MYRPLQCTIRIVRSEMIECERFLAQNLCRPKCVAWNKDWARFVALVTPEERVLLKLKFSDIIIHEDHLGVMGSI